MEETTSNMFNVDIHKIFVGNVPFDCTDEEFKNTFKDIDGYIKAEIIAKHFEEQSRGFGFITLEGLDNMEKLLNRTDIEISGRVLRFTKYVSNGKKYYDKIPNNYLILENVPSVITRQNLFDSIGKLTPKIGKYFIKVDRKTGKKLDVAIIEILDRTVYREILNIGHMVLYDDKKSYMVPAHPYKTHVIKKFEKRPTTLDIYNAFNSFTKS